MSWIKTASVASVLAFLIGSTAHASVVVSNLAESYDLGITSDGLHFAAAGSFTTSAAGTYKLNSVSLPIQVNSTLGDITELRLRADSGGSPGALLETLGSQFAPQGQTTLTYNSILGSILNPNSTYWVTLGETGSGGGQNWDGTFSTNQASPIGWTIGDQAMQSTNGGLTWQDVNAGPPNESPLFSIDATRVPEPATALLGFIGIGGLVLTQLRRVAKRTK